MSDEAVESQRGHGQEPEAVRQKTEEPAADAQLEAARKRIDELARAYQALERDREDFKQRLSRERERMIDVERGEVAVALIEAIDELDLSLASADDSPLAQGVRLIRDKLVKKLGSMGVQRVSLLGVQYDANLAEAAE